MFLLMYNMPNCAIQCRSGVNEILKSLDLVEMTFPRVGRQRVKMVILKHLQFEYADAIKH